MVGPGVGTAWNHIKTKYIEKGRGPGNRTQVPVPIVHVAYQLYQMRSLFIIWDANIIMEHENYPGILIKRAPGFELANHRVTTHLLLRSFALA